MPDDPKVSVLLPVRNGAPYFREALASVLAQDFADFELIVVDDGSSDDTPELLAACPDPRLRVIRKDGGGLVKALNVALEAARGDYVARMDADDIALPHRFSRQVAVLDADPSATLVHGAARVIDGAGRPMYVLAAEQLDPATRRAALLDEARHPPIIHPTVMMRRAALIADGGYRAVPSCEDHDLWLRVVGRWGFRAIAEPLLLYRQHEGGISRERAAEQAVSNLLNCVCDRLRHAGGPDLYLTDPAAYQRLRAAVEREAGADIALIVTARQVRSAMRKGQLAKTAAGLSTLMRSGGLSFLFFGEVQRRLQFLQQELLARALAEHERGAITT